MPACPGQVKIEVGQVKLGSHLPDGASKSVFLNIYILKKNSYKGLNFISGHVRAPWFGVIKLFECHFLLLCHLCFGQVDFVFRQVKLDVVP